MSCSAPAPEARQHYPAAEGWVEVVQRREERDGVPYVRITPPKPTRTIVYVHGGPGDWSSRRDADLEFPVFLASQYNAEVFVPVYYGSDERPAQRDVNGRSITYREGEAHAALLALLRQENDGMDRAAAEVRRFVVDSPRPVTVIGDSFGALLGALSVPTGFQGTFVVIAPMVNTPREFTAAAIAGPFPWSKRGPGYSLAGADDLKRQARTEPRLQRDAVVDLL